MTGNWDAPTEEYSGDVRLTGRHETPVGLSGAADVFVGAGAVDGTLRIDDAEYVFTDVVDGDATGAAQGDQAVHASDDETGHASDDGTGNASDGENDDATDGDVTASDTASDGDATAGDATTNGGSTGYAPVRTVVTGSLEDGYVERVDGDVALADVADVFVEYGGAAALDAAGAEQVFHDDRAAPTGSPDDYEVTVSGWNHSRDARDPRDGVSIRGAKNEVTVTEAKHDLTVYVTGWDNEVRVEGRDVDVTVFFVGRDNRVSVGPYVSVTTGAESGFDNVVDSDPIPADAVIQTSKDEAFSGAFVGRHKVTWQEAADDKDWCPNCGEGSDAVIQRRQKDALFLFGAAVRTYDSGGVSYECERCSPHVARDVSLTEDERKDALR